MNKKKYMKSYRSRRKIFIVLGVVFAVIMIGGTLGGNISSKFGSSQRHTQDLVQPQTASAIIQQISTPTISNAPALGDNNAPITLVEFGDYQVYILSQVSFRYQGFDSDKFCKEWQG